MTPSKGSTIVFRCATLFAELETLSEKEKIKAVNEIRMALREYSPFKSEPVDCVQWVPKEEVVANDYNPNAVAPPEMELLRTSIEQDGYTQPIVSWKNEAVYEVVDGYHRHRVGKECADIKARVRGYLPLVVINEGRADKGDRMAATVRHNRARGKHKVQAMSEIVTDLKRRRWSDEKIAKNLGMEKAISLANSLSIPVEYRSLWKDSLSFGPSKPLKTSGNT